MPAAGQHHRRLVLRCGAAAQLPAAGRTCAWCPISWRWCSCSGACSSRAWSAWASRWSLGLAHGRAATACCLASTRWPIRCSRSLRYGSRGACCGSSRARRRCTSCSCCSSPQACGRWSCGWRPATSFPGWPFFVGPLVGALLWPLVSWLLLLPQRRARARTDDLAAMSYRPSSATTKRELHQLPPAPGGGRRSRCSSRSACSRARFVYLQVRAARRLRHARRRTTASPSCRSCPTAA